MLYLRSCRKILSPFFGFSTATKKQMKPVAIASAAIVLILPCLAQEQPLPPAKPTPATVEIKSTVTIPAGTRIGLVLTQPIQSRHVRRGDDVFAQVISPVATGNQVVIPAGTFVQGSIDTLGRKSTQGEVRLNSLAITFPDGYMTPIAGPITLHSDEGYAIKDPGWEKSGLGLGPACRGSGHRRSDRPLSGKLAIHFDDNSASGLHRIASILSNVEHDSSGQRRQRYCNRRGNRRSHRRGNSDGAAVQLSSVLPGRGCADSDDLAAARHISAGRSVESGAGLTAAPRPGAAHCAVAGLHPVPGHRQWYAASAAGYAADSDPGSPGAKRSPRSADHHSRYAGHLVK